MPPAVAPPLNGAAPASLPPGPPLAPRRRRWLESATTVAFLAFLVVLFVHGYRTPHRNWDVLGYAACVLELSNPDQAAVHREVYRQVRAWTPDETWAELVNPADDYRRECAASAEAFTQQLPYYRIRLFYTSSVRALHALGVPLPDATALVSGLATFGLAVLFWSWLARDRAPGWALAATALAVFAMSLPHMARLSTPDTLASLLRAAGAYLLLVHRSWIAGLAVMHLAIWTRTDSAVFALVLPAVARFQTRPIFTRKVVWGIAAYIVVTVAAVGVVNRLAGAYPHHVVFYNEFVRLLSYPADHLYHVSLVDQLRTAGIGWRCLVQESHYMLLLLVALLTLALAQRQRPTAPTPWILVVSSLAGFACHYSLHPSIDPRHYVLNFWFVFLAAGLIFLPARRPLPACA